MSITIFGELINGVLTLHPIFTVTLFDGQPLEQAEFSTETLIINGENVRQCDSVGIAALIWLTEKAREENVSLIWKNLPSAITHLLDLYELDLLGLTTICKNN